MNVEEEAVIDKLTDDEKIQWLGNISKREFKILTALQIRANVFEDATLQEMVDAMLRLSASRDSKRTEQIIEFGKAVQMENLPPEERIDSFDDSGKLLTVAEEGVEKA